MLGSERGSQQLDELERVFADQIIESCRELSNNIEGGKLKKFVEYINEVTLN